MAWLCRIALAVAAALMAGGATAAGAADLAVVGATIYPSPSAAPIRNGVVLIHDGRIAALGPAAKVRIPPGAQVIHADGEVVTAGFWNSHVHIFTHDLLHQDQKTDAALSATLTQMFNRWGFTTVFDVASILDNTLGLKARIDAGRFEGPQILTVGEPFFPLNGTPIYIRDFVDAEHVVLPETTSIPNGLAREDRELAAGADGVKLFTGDIVGGDIGIQLMDPALVKALVAEAHRHGAPVFAHPSNLPGMELALNGGVDVLAHTAPRAGAWSPQLVRRMIDAHMALIPTLTLFDVEAKRAGLSAADTAAGLATDAGQLHDFAAAGGEVLFGTDVGYTDAVDTTEEYQLMARAGLDWRAILASLTTAPANRFPKAGRRGMIVPGAEGDLVILRRDPAADVSAFADVVATIRAGRLIYRRGGD